MEDNEKKPLRQVAKSARQTDDKKLADKFHDAIIAEDIKDASVWFLKKRLIPGFKQGVVDFISRVLLGGESVTTAARKTIRTTGGSYVDYNGVYKQYRASDVVRESRTDASARGSSYRIGTIYVASRAEALEINEEMASRIRDYGAATCADLFSLCGITRTNHMDNKWGWTSATSFRFRPSGDEWILDYDNPEFLGN